MHTLKEPETLQQKYRFRSRDTSKFTLKTINTSSSSSSSNTTSSSNTSSSNSSSSNSSDDGCQFQYQIGDSIDKYKITAYLCDGTFGKVLEVIDEANQPFAVKIMNDTDHTEVGVLRKIQSVDPYGEAGIVKFYDYFTQEDYHCIVFERLDINLYQHIKETKSGFTLQGLQKIFRQVTISLQFLHNLGITHTDLKPENIVFSDRQKYQNEKKLSLQVKLIDLGGATLEEEHHSAVINTRQYRAPEVILRSAAWDTSSDIWCLACVVVELYTGLIFIKAHNDDLQHLRMIEHIIGPIPRWMKERSKLKNLKDLQDNQNIKETKLDDLIKDKELLELLKWMLQIDHYKRPNCEQILSHQFFQKKL